MKIGFSSSVCPGWDLQTMVQQAQTLGYKAIELHGLQGHAHLPTCPALADAGAVTAMFAAAKVELVALATDCAFSSADRQETEANRGRLQETLDLAGKLGCPFVTVKAGSIPPCRARDHVLGRIVDSLRAIAPYAAERRVSILVENADNLATARDLWYILDAVGHPAVRCCWNPCTAIVAGDSHSVAVPRIARVAAITHLVDAARSAVGAFDHYVKLGEGQADLSRYLVLMEGIGADSHLVVDWPASVSPPDPKEVLPAAIAWINNELNKIAKAPELSAYKGDKNAPRYAKRVADAATVTSGAAALPSRATANG